MKKVALLLAFLSHLQAAKATAVPEKSPYNWTATVSHLFADRLPGETETTSIPNNETRELTIKGSKHRCSISSSGPGGMRELSCNGVGITERDLETAVDQANLATIRGSLRDIFHCQEQLLRESPNASGTMLVRISVDPTGHVDLFSVQDNSTGNANLRQCVRAKVMGWAFPKQKNGKPALVDYRFVFKP